MTTRPLFDQPPSIKPKPRLVSATPTIPVPTKVAPESWTVRFTAAPGNDAPPICRVRMLLKTAWRRHRLRATIVEPLGTIATPGIPTASISSEASAGQPEAFTRELEVIGKH